MIYQWTVISGHHGRHRITLNSAHVDTANYAHVTGFSPFSGPLISYDPILKKGH